MTEQPDTKGTEAEEAVPPRLSTAATRTFGVLTVLAVAVCVVLAVRRPWNGSGDPLLVRAVAVALGFAALRVLACFRAPRAAAPVDRADPGPPRPTPGELRGAARLIRRRAWRRGLGAGALTLLTVAAVPALVAPFSGAPEEAAGRLVALEAAGARWDAFEILPPVVNGDPLPAYPRHTPYRLGPVDGTSGEPIDLDRSDAVDGLAVGTRLRVLHVPGGTWPGPLAEREIEPFLEPAPLRRVAGAVWASVALAAGLIGLAAGRAWYSTPGRSGSEAFLTGPLHWARVRVPGTTVEAVRTDIEPEPGEEPATEARMLLEPAPGARRAGETAPAPEELQCSALGAGRGHLTPATGWLARKPGSGRAMLVLDDGTTVWATVPGPAEAPPEDTAPADAVADGADRGSAPRVLAPTPGVQHPWGSALLLGAAGWPAGLLLHRLLTDPGAIVPAKRFAGELIGVPLLVGLGLFAVLLVAGLVITVIARFSD
ncbi:hypothetical protein [Kitasatospora sp. NPDC056184]|uniref:hypothetical protein n=1 Tax=Kitasatospora sp. NPDC056184 TaxID=3345738 RepID=UPI0035D5EEB8